MTSAWPWGVHGAVLNVSMKFPAGLVIIVAELVAELSFDLFLIRQVGTLILTRHGLVLFLCEFTVFFNPGGNTSHVIDNAIVVMHVHVLYCDRHVDVPGGHCRTG